MLAGMKQTTFNSARFALGQRMLPVLCKDIGPQAPKALLFLSAVTHNQSKFNQVAAALSHQKDSAAFQVLSFRVAIHEAIKYARTWVYKCTSTNLSWGDLQKMLLSDDFAWRTFIDAMKYGLQDTLLDKDDEQVSRLPKAFLRLINMPQNDPLQDVVGKTPFSKAVIIGAAGANHDWFHTACFFSRLTAEQLKISAARPHTVIAIDASFVALEKALSNSIPEYWGRLAFSFDNLFYVRRDLGREHLDIHQPFSDAMNPERKYQPLNGRAVFLADEVPVQIDTIEALLKNGDVLLYRDWHRNAFSIFIKEEHRLTPIFWENLASLFGKDFCEALKPSERKIYNVEMGEDDGDEADGMHDYVMMSLWEAAIAEEKDHPIKHLLLPK